MIAGGAAHAAAGLLTADINLCWPGLFRQAAQQASTVVLLFFLAVFGGGFAALVAGTDAVLLVVGIDRRQVAVVTQHLFQFAQRWGGGNMGDLTAHRINRQRFAGRQFAKPMAVGQDHRRMLSGFSLVETELPAAVGGGQGLDVRLIVTA
ncbi:hypothetical protein D3C78_1159390 [compost metagenome]